MALMTTTSSYSSCSTCTSAFRDFRRASTAVQCFGHGDGTALFNGVGHLLEHDGMGVAAGHRESTIRVVLHILRHGRFRLVGALHDGIVVVAGRGQHVVAGEQEDGRKAKQGKVDAVVADMVRHRIQTVGCRHDAEHEDGQRHIAVHRLALQLGALAALGGAQLFGELRLFLQIFFWPCAAPSRCAWPRRSAPAACGRPFRPPSSAGPAHRLRSAAGSAAALWPAPPAACPRPVHP